MMTSTQLEVSI